MSQKPTPAKPARTFQRLTIRLKLHTYEDLEAARGYEPREAFIKRAIVALIEQAKA